MNELKPNEVRSEQSGLLSLPFLAFFCSPLMEDHPVKRRRIEEPAEAAQATVAQTREAGQTTSRYNGVSSWHRGKHRWRATIKHEGRNQHVGYFDEEQDAARAFDEAALRLRGAEAHGGRHAQARRVLHLNFPPR